MNIENFKRLRDHWMTVSPEAVKMENWFTIHVPEGYADEDESFYEIVYSAADLDVPDMTGADCGTSACLAGHCQWKFAEGDEREEGADTFATEFLELTANEADDIFCCHSYYDPTVPMEERDMAMVTHEQVLRNLNRIINTGRFYSEEHYNEH